MEFHVLPRGTAIPANGINIVYLSVDYWNDFSYVTQFDVSMHDEQGKYHPLGQLKIGFRGQTTEHSTHSRLGERFASLSSEFFSLGQTVDYYKRVSSLDRHTRELLLSSLRDIVFMPEVIDANRDEKVFGTSLLRYVSLSIVRGQFRRVLDGKSELTDYKFTFARAERENMGALSLDFEVEVGAQPSTNIHAVIGRNGVGKTTLLNGMIDAVIRRNGREKFIDRSNIFDAVEISTDYFSSLVSVSFSAFDPFQPPQEQSDPAKGTCYFYIGLKDSANAGSHRDFEQLQRDCARDLSSCFSSVEKTARWMTAIEKLGSDENFYSMKLQRLEASYKDLREQEMSQTDSAAFRERYFEVIQPYLDRMSSGHAIVLMIVTRLVATVEEKTLVLLDEPESHLHPPLLSAFIRALSELLHDRNGVAIIATHSPVVLQEIPKKCAWKLHRSGKEVTPGRPTIETFGENVGTLTTEVFSLEVARSGFHDLLAKSVESGMSYDDILKSYRGQLGVEGRAVLKALVVDRDLEVQR